MQSWIWILTGGAALVSTATVIIRYNSIQKYKRHIEYLKKSMRMDRNELSKMATEKQYLEKEMDVIKNIYRNKLLSIHQPDDHTGKNA